MRLQTSKRKKICQPGKPLFTVRPPSGIGFPVAVLGRFQQHGNFNHAIVRAGVEVAQRSEGCWRVLAF
jgi:hypothetical protein